MSGVGATPLVRGGNVFWNVLSICSMCGHPVTMRGSVRGVFPSGEVETGETKAEKPGDKFSVNEAVLKNYDLTGIHLEGADLRYAHLEGVRLAESRLMGANLQGAYLEGADLRNANLRDATLDGAHLKGADLRNANLRDATLDGAHLGDADLRRADLTRAKLEGAYMSGANLKGTVFRNAHMEGSALEGAVLDAADFGGAHLEGSHLDGIAYDEGENVWRGAAVGTFTMHETKFTGARLDGAFLSEGQVRYVRDAGALGVPGRIPKVKWIHETGLLKRTKVSILQITRNGKTETIDLADFGHYRQGADGEVLPLSWRVLRLEYDKALIITEKLIECRPYHDRFEDITWETCDLWKWLNGDFLELSFTESERAMIARVCNQNPDHAEFGTRGGSPTWDRVFALSMDEAYTYFRNDGDRMAAPTPYAKRKGSYSRDVYKLPNGEPTGWWWLRSPGFFGINASFVDYGGGVHVHGNCVYDSGGSVRPALWLNL